ncbi:MAG: hypothetical protein ACF8TS_12765 [Maioricimonas sp. JB049]
MSVRQISWKTVTLVQVLVLMAFAVAIAVDARAVTEAVSQRLFEDSPFEPVPIPREKPLVVTPLYDRPDFVSNEDLAAVLRQIRPQFDREQMKPNYVEHALRAWGVRAQFADPAIPSGEELALFLTDHARFSDSWGKQARPLLIDRPQGIAIRWGRETGASVHHDHWLASLTEAGVSRDTPVYGPARRDITIGDVVQESLRDFRLDERETEWTAMAFGLWLPPTRHWTGGDGRQYSFDLIARRLMRGHKEKGVCSGTHRVYSLVLLIRLNDEFDILSDAMRAEVYGFLEDVRDAITAAQFEDGHWPSNWPDGAAAVARPVDDPVYRQVIATGHHLEWLAIAPRDLHPPDDQIRRAAEWVIRTTVEQPTEDILTRYTFYSHVGNALALWRNTHPADFWMAWIETHPDVAVTELSVEADDE